MNTYKWQSLYSGSSLPSAKAVKFLIAVNVIIFLLVNIIHKVNWPALFGLVPRQVFARFMIWQLVTYMFVHLNLWHLLINMMMLWFFGAGLESVWGKKQFLFYYFLTGMGAGLCSFITSFNSYTPVIGASGAIFGILTGYALVFPETIILLFFIFPMKIKHAVIVLAAVNLLAALSSSGSNIAYFAHLGGALVGYLYLRNKGIRRQFAGFDSLSSRLWWEGRRMRRRQQAENNPNEQVDFILDKISRYGMKSLSRREKEILERKKQSGG